MKITGKVEESSQYIPIIVGSKQQNTVKNVVLKQQFITTFAV